MSIDPEKSWPRNDGSGISKQRSLGAGYVDPNIRIATMPTEPLRGTDKERILRRERIATELIAHNYMYTTTFAFNFAEEIISESDKRGMKGLGECE